MGRLFKKKGEKPFFYNQVFPGICLPIKPPEYKKISNIFFVVFFQTKGKNINFDHPYFLKKFVFHSNKKGKVALSLDPTGLPRKKVFFDAEVFTYKTTLTPPKIFFLTIFKKIFFFP